MNAKRLKPSSKPAPSDTDPSLPDEHDGAAKNTGRVVFDDRGNAMWEWAMANGGLGNESSTDIGATASRLRSPGKTAKLSVATDAPSRVETVRANPLGAKKGYDPYDSGRLGKKGTPRKKDLRRLSEWMKIKKQAEETKKRRQESEE